MSLHLIGPVAHRLEIGASPSLEYQVRLGDDDDDDVDGGDDGDDGGGNDDDGNDDAPA